MKRLLLISAILIAAAIMAWGLWRRRKTDSAPLAGGSVHSAAAQHTAAGSKIPASGSVVGGAGAAAKVSGRPNLAAQLTQVMENSNRPISFFGRVIDQDGNGIPGVKVTFLIRSSRAVGAGIGDTFSEPSVSSDAAGRFALMDQRGAVLTVKSLEKLGYEPSEQATRGTYWYWRDKDPYRPDPDNPRLFHMWRKAGAEPLIVAALSEEVPCDGTPVQIDLLSGARVQSGGDLRVTLTRNPTNITYGQRHFEWALTVVAPHGGLIASHAEQMYSAPIDGYRDQAVLHVAADDPEWSNAGAISVYLKLRDGKYYGRAEIKVIAGSSNPATPLYVTAFINPRGSRNLEYDPMLRNPSAADSPPSQ